MENFNYNLKLKNGIFSWLVKKLISEMYLIRILIKKGNTM